jgi:hypothetical protein
MIYLSSKKVVHICAHSGIPVKLLIIIKKLF